MLNKALKIILIETNLVEQNRLEQLLNYLENFSFNIIYCESFKAGLEQLNRETFDLILLDFDLSNDDHINYLSILNENYPTVPIIILINSDNEELLTEIIPKFAQDYLLKTELNLSLWKRCFYYAIEQKKSDLALKKAHQELEEFTYMVSHDLKQPLSTISCWTQMLYMRHLSQLDDKGKKYVNSILKGTQQMDQLIEILLIYSRIGTKKKEFQPTNCEEVIKQVFINLEKIIVENKAIITLDPLPIITVDSAQWQQLWENLIENGIKFHRDETPNIHISANLKNEQEWVFSITDNGMGIESEYYHKIFKVFQKLHPQTEYSGHGMGLAICDRIVKKHGGKIWVESEVDKGSTFYFTVKQT